MKQASQANILITGGCGYLGSQLIRDLVHYGSCIDSFSIRILDNLHSGNYRSLMDLPQQGCYEFVEGDILDPATLRLALRNIDTVIHLAAIVRTPMSFESPTWLEQVNHWGTAHLVETCLEAGIANIIYASSTAVYGPGDISTEHSICQPQGAYAKSKRHAEETLVSAKERGLKPIILRFGSLYGEAPAIRFDAFINRLIYLAGIERSLTVFGNGHQKRPVLHVQDASHTICELVSGNLVSPSDILNVVEANISVMDAVQAIQSAKSNTVVQFTEQDIRSHLSFEVDNTQLRSCGWQPQHTIETGIKQLLKHFQCFQKLNYG